MQHKEIVNRLSRITANSSEIIYSVTMKDLLTAVVARLGDEALNLSNVDLLLAREQVKEAINHNLDIREYIDMGLDVWEITRKL